MRSTVLRCCPELRRQQIYGVGTAKSGTHSIAAMFEDQLNAGHEPESGALIRQVLDAASEGRRIPDQFVRERDRRLALEVDSSNLNVYLVEPLVRFFPAARFILTIREPRSWLDSLINHMLRLHRPSDEWLALRRYRFRPDLYTHRPEEAVLKERGLFTLDGFLTYWVGHNRTVLEAVPAERLLVVRTDEITDRAGAIAAFVGVPEHHAQQNKSHAFKAPAQFGVLDQIPAAFVDEKIAEHCADLVARFFPFSSQSDRLA